MFTYVYTDGVSALNISARLHERMLCVVVSVGEEVFWDGLLSKLLFYQMHIFLFHLVNQTDFLQLY